MLERASEWVAGEIASLGLSGWWLSTFGEERREWMANTFAPMGIGSPGEVRPLIEGNGTRGPDRAFEFMSLLATWFNRPGYQDCALAFLAKSREFYSENLPVLARHFGWMEHCQVYYRWREQPGSLAKAIEACELGIAINREAASAFLDTDGALPSHHCFNQLRIIEEKRLNFGRAKELCRAAAEVGWAGDWKGAIERIDRKIAKAEGARSQA